MYLNETSTRTCWRSSASPKRRSRRSWTARPPRSRPACSAYYRDFSQTTDDDVVELLERARGGGAGAEAEEEPEGPPGDELPVAIEIDDGARLEGSLTIPAGATGLVLFAHGSGSSRHSPRNRFVAEVLQGAGLATLLFDLLNRRGRGGG
ncbi:hypothetical protein WMF20_45545 [Sorangium sp. So ce834]